MACIGDCPDRDGQPSAYAARLLGGCGELQIDRGAVRGSEAQGESRSGGLGTMRISRIEVVEENGAGLDGRFGAPYFWEPGTFVSPGERRRNVGSSAPCAAIHQQGPGSGSQAATPTPRTNSQI
jgi:hypothetical protein